MCRGREETPSSAGECYQLWCHRDSGAFYAVRLSEDRIKGACALFDAAMLAGRYRLGSGDFAPTLGVQIARERQAFAIVEEW
jgi:hypothetical protein